MACHLQALNIKRMEGLFSNVRAAFHKGFKPVLTKDIIIYTWSYCTYLDIQKTLQKDTPPMIRCCYYRFKSGNNNGHDKRHWKHYPRSSWFSKPVKFLWEHLQLIKIQRITLLIYLLSRLRHSWPLCHPASHMNSEHAKNNHISN